MKKKKHGLEVFKEIPTEVIEKRKEAARNKMNKHKAKAKYTKASLKTKARKLQLKPDEREHFRAIVVQHFGYKVVEKALEKCFTKKAQGEVLLELKYRMEKELEEQEVEVAEYIKKIENEFRQIGRPKSVFNFRELEYLCSIGCTLEEISGFFQLSKDSVMLKIKAEYGLTFNEYYDRHSQGIKVALRRRQIRTAMDGDVQMLKFLGKNYLGQKEKVDFDGQVKVNSWVDLVKNLGGEESEGDDE